MTLINFKKDNLYNSNSKALKSEHFRKQVELLTFSKCYLMAIKQMQYSKYGKYGGTYSYKDIASRICLFYWSYFYVILDLMKGRKIN